MSERLYVDENAPLLDDSPSADEIRAAKINLAKMPAPVRDYLRGLREYTPTVDLATEQPYYGLGDPSQTADIAAPPNQDQQVQHIAEILLAGYAIAKTAAMIGAVIGVPGQVVGAVLHATGGMAGHKAHARLQHLALSAESAGADVARAAARQEIFYRASYLINAVHRVEADVAKGESLPEAVAGEKANFQAHEQARRGRLDAAASVGQKANMFGDLLGWYLDPLINNEIECITANGHNFHASESTMIGWPGSVHRNCGCVAGPPIPGAGMVNDALSASRQVIFHGPKVYKLRRSA